LTDWPIMVMRQPVTFNKLGDMYAHPNN